MIWVTKLIFSLLPKKDNLVLSMDRTNWKFGDKNINILMLGISYKNVAFPIMFNPDYAIGKNSYFRCCKPNCVAVEKIRY